MLGYFFDALVRKTIIFEELKKIAGKNV